MATTVDRLELIENVGPNSLLAALKNAAGSARHIDLEVAFVAMAGLLKVLPLLKRVAERGGVRIITGLYQGITEAKALSELLQVQEESNQRLQVRIAEETHFHRKMYLVRHRTRSHAIVGSSNLTLLGLRSGGEMNLLVTTNASSAIARRLNSVFTTDWDRAFPLTKPMVRRYANLVRPRHTTLPAGLLSQVLGKRGAHGMADDEGSTGSLPVCWVDGISGWVKKKTEAIVADETDWEDAGHDWYASRTSAIKRDDKILLFLRNRKPARVKVVRVVGYTRTAANTPDGRHFVAFEDVARMAARRITRQLIGRLRRSGLEHLDGSRHRVRPSIWKNVSPLFARRGSG
jgi:HKD family nuclease